MRFIKLKSIKVFSNGCLIFYKSNLIKFNLCLFVKRDLLNLKKKEFIVKKKLKHLISYTNKYLNLQNFIYVIKL